jgi:7,8-dihydroneopterin aldolase/epimerase/oxygenase
VGVTVELRGLELHGFHGLLPEERLQGQPFLVDVELDVDEAAARSDDLADAVDYREAAAAVREVFESTRFDLLEALAWALAGELLRRFPVERARVRVRKPEVALESRVEFSAVSVERGRARGRS